VLGVSHRDELVFGHGVVREHSLDLLEVAEDLRGQRYSIRWPLIVR